MNTNYCSNENTNNDILVASVFMPLFVDNYENYALGSGRVSGKSKTAYILGGVQSAVKPNEDIVIARASYGSIADSSYAEMEEVFSDIPQFEHKFKMRKSPLRMSRVDGGTNIYFEGIGGSIDRTKGIKTKHPVGLLIIEEAQELKSKEHLDQTIASLRRRFGEGCKVVVCFNPPAQELHWINVWYVQKKMDADWCCIHASWEDISMFLSDREIKEIWKFQVENKAYYDYMYMGIPSGAEGSCYPMFHKSRHIITPREYELLYSNGIRPVLALMGGDGAVNHDATAFTLNLIMNNGEQVVASIFYHNPKINGVIGSHQLVSKMLVRWFDEVCKQFNLGSIEEIQLAQRFQRKINIVPIQMIIDSAATDLIQECRYYFSNRADVKPIKKGTIPQMVGSCQDALMSNAVHIIDWGGHYNYFTNQWEKDENNLLASQISMLVWDKTQTKYDNIVPNDVCDSWTYPTYYWYKNIENIHSFDILKANSINLPKINAILKR